jgi:uncharacterized protein YqjF (DUF2071 family)
MAGNQPEEVVSRAVARQAWRRMSFLHWRMPPDELGARLPTGLVPDIVDGSAWVSLTPFCVERFGVVGTPPVPSLSTFPETNLRTYVRTKDGRDGLWFLSLDVGCFANAMVGRLIVPYHWSAMSVAGGDTVRYRAERRGVRGVGHDIVVRPGHRLDSNVELAEALAGRWRAFTCVGGRLVEIPVEHEPWTLRQAELLCLEETVFAAAGLERPHGEPLVHYSDGVNARLGSPRSAPR